MINIPESKKKKKKNVGALEYIPVSRVQPVQQPYSAYKRSGKLRYTRSDITTSGSYDRHGSDSLMHQSFETPAPTGLRVAQTPQQW